MAVSDTGTLPFIGDVAEDRSRIYSEVFRDVRCAQIQLDAAKLIGQHFIVQIHNEPKHSQRNPRTYYSKEVEHSQMIKSITSSEPD